MFSAFARMLQIVALKSQAVHISNHNYQFQDARWPIRKLQFLLFLPSHGTTAVKANKKCESYYSE